MRSAWNFMPTWLAKRRRAAQAAVAVALLLALVLPGAVRAQGHVLLGINYPLTGPYSVEGLDQIRAARMAVDEINAAGGILGSRVVLVARDSASDVLQTRLNVQEFMDIGCSMVFGGASSAVAIEAGHICQHNGVPFFGTLTYSTATTGEAGHRFMFRECNDSWMSAQVLGPWLNERFAGKRYFYITSDYTWGWTTEESLRQATGTEDREAHVGVLKPFGSTNFRSELVHAAALKPDVLVLVLFGKDLSACLREAYAMGLSRQCQVVVPNLTLGMAERAGTDAMEGVVGTLPWHWRVPYDEDHPKGREFVEEYVRRFRRYPSTSGASAYSIVHEFKAAAERAGSLAGAKVVKALEGHAYRRLKGEQVWRALDHQSVQTVYLVRGKPTAQVLQDTLRMDYFEILGSRPGPEIVRSEDEWKRLRIKAGLLPHLEPLAED